MNLEGLKKIARQENINILRKEIGSKWVLEKIKSHIERNNYLNLTVQEVQEKILKDDLTASFFIKDPSKQNFTEKFIGEYLSKVNLFMGFSSLGSTSNLFVSNGEISTERVVGMKSIDFKWVVGENYFFATQKYTSQKGGAQDNQYNDVVSFIKEANFSKNENLFFFAIVDGDYYTDFKIAELKRIATSPNIKICSFMEVEEECRKINSN